MFFVAGPVFALPKCRRFSPKSLRLYSSCCWTSQIHGCRWRKGGKKKNVSPSRPNGLPIGRIGNPSHRSSSVNQPLCLVDWMSRKVWRFWFSPRASNFGTSRQVGGLPVGEWEWFVGIKSWHILDDRLIPLAPLSLVGFYMAPLKV